MSNSSINRKKIIIIGPAYPYRGGNSLFVMYLYKSLIKTFDVKIYNYTLLYPSLLFPGTTQYDKSEQQISVPSERIVNSINPFNWIITANRLKKENADMVVFDWWHPFFGLCHGVISKLIKKHYRNKILFITENVISHEGNWIDQFLTKFGLRNASFFLALSNVVENELKKYAPNKKVFRSELPVYDCYKKADSKELQELKAELKIKNDDLVLLFFGYVRKYKGLDILIDAMPEILTVNPKTKLIIVGEFYDSPTRYLDQINKSGLEKSITIVNKFIPNEQVAKYYDICDIVVLPYRSATQSGILNVAYGYLKPVIVTKVGGLADFVEEGATGFVVDPNSANQITSGIKKYLEAKSKINFTANIKEYNSKNSFAKINEVFSEILNESSSALN